MHKSPASLQLVGKVLEAALCCNEHLERHQPACKCPLHCKQGICDTNVTSIYVQARERHCNIYNIDQRIGVFTLRIWYTTPSLGCVITSAQTGSISVKANMKKFADRWS